MKMPDKVEKSKFWSNRSPPPTQKLGICASRQGTLGLQKSSGLDPVYVHTYMDHKICPLINSLSYVLILPHQIIPCQSQNMKITKAQTIASKKKGVVFFVQVAAAFSKGG